MNGTGTLVVKFRDGIVDVDKSTDGLIECL